MPELIVKHIIEGGEGATATGGEPVALSPASAEIMTVMRSLEAAIKQLGDKVSNIKSTGSKTSTPTQASIDKTRLKNVTMEGVTEQKRLKSVQQRLVGAFEEEDKEQRRKVKLLQDDNKSAEQEYKRRQQWALQSRQQGANQRNEKQAMYEGLFDKQDTNKAKLLDTENKEQKRKVKLLEDDNKLTEQEYKQRQQWALQSRQQETKKRNETQAMYEGLFGEQKSTTQTNGSRIQIPSALSNIGGTVATALLAAGVTTAVRTMLNSANKNMGNAGAGADFLSSYVSGNVNNGALGNYYAKKYDVQSQYERQQHSINQEGLQGAAGAATGAIAGGLAGSVIPIIGNLAGAVGGATTGGALGAASGSLSASKNNANVMQRLAMESARAQIQSQAVQDSYLAALNHGQAATERIQIGRGLDKQDTYNVTSMQKSIMHNFDTDKNLPYQAKALQVAQMLRLSDKDTLAQVTPALIQRMNQTGTSPQQLYGLSEMFSTIGKNKPADIMDRLANAQDQYGIGFTADTMMNSAGYRRMGYSGNKAEDLAFQSQFNPSVANSVQQYQSQGIVDFYKNQALSKMVGYNINAAKSSGSLNGLIKPAQRAELEKELSDYTNKNILGKQLQNSMIAGIMPDQLSGLLASPASKLKGGAQPAGASQIEDFAKEMADAFKNITTMNITAQNVNLTAMYGATVGGNSSSVGGVGITENKSGSNYPAVMTSGSITGGK